MSDAARPIAIHGVVPAAGLSRRMGRAKQSLPFGASSITGTVVNTMLSAGVDTVTVVTRTELAGSLGVPDGPRVVVLLNDEPSSEMIDSIRIALRHINRTRPGQDAGECHDGVLVVPGDMPAVPVIAYQRTMAAFKKDPSKIIIASHRGKRGHPVIFPLALSAALSNIRGGLNELPRQFPDVATTVDVPDPGVVRDIDNPADYELLRGGGGQHPCPKQ